MTRDPVRWLESSEPSELRALMRVGAEELAPPDALARVAQRMRAPASAASAPAPSTRPKTSPAPGARIGLGVKALGLALLLAAAGLSLYPRVRPTAPASVPVRGSVPREQAATPLRDSQRTLPSPAPTTAPTTAPGEDAAPPPVVSLAGAPRAQTARQRAEPAAHSSLRSRARTDAQPSAPPSAQPVDTRLAEARLLEQARRELSVQPDHALALLREHATQFPQSWLEEEREAMLIVALAQTAQSAAARVQLARFKARFPQSVHTPRLEHTLAPR